jgi:ribosomal protein L11 methyltransferase
LAVSPLIRLAVRVDGERAELVLAELLELAPGGVEEVELEDGAVEYAVYGAAGELPTLPALTAAAGDALVEIISEELPDGWEERWREFHRPLVLGTRLTVRPPWESPGDTDLDLVIDPGQAFGTGAHATTRLCLELLLELAPGGAFVDLGSGSGVLAIAAARLGYQPVSALDNDPLALEATRANAARNGVELEDVRRSDLRIDLPALRGATVAANLLAPLLLGLAQRLSARQRLPERLIASGLMVEEADRVLREFAHCGLHPTMRRECAGWTAIVLEPGQRQQVS